MPPAGVVTRVARADDAERVAALHTASWRQHHRGVYADSFLDGEVLADRRAAWWARLSDTSGSLTVLAERSGVVIGFIHVVLDDDAQWGSLIDNLHVAHLHQGTGIGTLLLERAAQGILEGATTRRAYLWVLKQSTNAQGFYRARGGTFVEEAAVPSPGGIPSRLEGTPMGIRIAWPDASVLVA